MTWKCGRCEQEKLIAEGKPVGELIPSHFRTCPKREPPAEPVKPPETERLKN